MPEIFLGDLSQVKLFDILKPLLMGKKTGKLSFRGKENGEMYLDAGDIVHAKAANSFGEYAFFSIMGWKAGRISFEPDESPPEKTIPIPSEQLLLNWSSKKIEWERIREVIPSNNAVFTLSTRSDSENKNITPDQWSVLALSNGTRSISEVANFLDWDEFKVIRTVYQLIHAGLMEQAGERRPVQKKLVRENVFSVIENELRKVMGAVSPFVVDDKLVEFDEKRDSFPQDKLLSFVEALGEEIPHDGRRREFKKKVMESISVEK